MYTIEADRYKFIMHHCLYDFFARMVFLCFLWVESTDLHSHKFIIDFRFNVINDYKYTTKLTVCIFERQIKCMWSVKKYLPIVVVMSFMSNCFLERKWESFLFSYRVRDFIWKRNQYIIAKTLIPRRSIWRR